MQIRSVGPPARQEGRRLATRQMEPAIATALNHFKAMVAAVFFFCRARRRGCTAGADACRYEGKRKQNIRMENVPLMKTLMNSHTPGMLITIMIAMKPNWQSFAKVS